MHGIVSIFLQPTGQYHESGTNILLLLVVLVLLFVFRSLGAVLGTGLLSVGHACGIQSSSYDVVSGTGKVFDSSAADQNNAVLLQVVSLTRNVAGHFDAVRKTYSGDLTKSRVRLLRGRGLYCGAYASLLRRRLNSYHRRVYETLSPYLTDAEKEWLKKYTREI